MCRALVIRSGPTPSLSTPTFDCRFLCSIFFSSASWLWCYRLCMFIVVSLSLFSSSLSNVLCFCLFLSRTAGKWHMNFSITSTFWNCVVSTLMVIIAQINSLHCQITPMIYIECMNPFHFNFWSNPNVVLRKVINQFFRSRFDFCMKRMNSFQVRDSVFFLRQIFVFLFSHFFLFFSTFFGRNLYNKLWNVS